MLPFIIFLIYLFLDGPQVPIQAKLSLRFSVPYLTPGFQKLRKHNDFTSVPVLFIHPKEAEHREEVY